MRWSKQIAVILVSVILLSLPVTGFSQQQGGSLRGTVKYDGTGDPLHNVSVRIVQMGREAQTDQSGVYEFTNIPPGTYTVLAHLEGFPDIAHTVTVTAGGTATIDFRLQLTGVREQVTVTATGAEQSTFDALQSVNTMDSSRLTEESSVGLGEVLEKEPGIAKRSFGPGASRPVIRGFDGDRVLVLQDGIRVGSLGSQSGDHGEPIDVLSLERLEVVKGPATLLYGSNAIGGVVNAVTGRDEGVHPGWRGYFTALGGTTNNQAGISGSVEHGRGPWVLWGTGTGQRTGDYNTPLGRVINTKARVGAGSGGFGFYEGRGFFTGSYSYDNRRFGVPFAALFEGVGEEEETALSQTAFNVNPSARQLDEEEVELIDLSMRRKDLRFSGGFREADSFVTGMRLTFSYSDYQHQELEGEAVGTTFNNSLFNFRGVFDQRRAGRLSGSFGFEGYSRNYETIGAEALVKGPVRQNNFAIFGLQTLDFERVRVQFGARLENNRYNPSDINLPDRSFTGFSGGAGLRVGLWRGGAFVANYMRAYRSPALEELYNFGPHIGNLTFEVGNPNLRRELNDGIDFSVRHSTSRVRAEFNLYYYNLRNFVFLAPVDEDGDGEIDVKDGLPVAEYLQGNSRFVGTEAGLDLRLLPRHLWLNLGFDYVNAEQKETNTPLPRIPPLRGRIGLDARFGSLSIRPEAILVRSQERIFPTETRTAGYAVFNLLGSYTIARPHYAHIFSVNAFNLGDRLYRNHLSFIKELAPEIGRGVRVSYTVRFF